MDLKETIAVTLVCTVLVGGSIGAAVMYYLESLEVYPQYFYVYIQPDGELNESVSIHIPLPLKSDLDDVDMYPSGISDMSDCVSYPHYSQYNTTDHHYVNLTVNSTKIVHVACTLNGGEASFIETLLDGMQINLESSNMTAKFRVMYYHYQEGDNRCDAYYLNLYNKEDLSFKEMFVNHLFAENVPVQLTSGANILAFHEQSVKMY